MDHFYDRPAFRYVVRLPLSSSDELEHAACRRREKTILNASHILFQNCVDEA